MSAGTATVPNDVSQSLWTNGWLGNDSFLLHTPHYDEAVGRWTALVAKAT
jgi:hypothetical protein